MKHPAAAGCHPASIIPRLLNTQGEPVDLFRAAFPFEYISEIEKKPSFPLVSPQTLHYVRNYS
jgi:hypothetical protein